MQTVRHDGRETAYRRTAFDDELPPILFVHGSGSTHEQWAKQYEAARYPAVAVDLSGHGDSEDVDAAPGYETLDAYGEDVLAVARETGARVFVGNAVGGAVLLHLVVERGLSPAAVALVGSGATLGVADELLEFLESDFERAIEFLHAEDRLFHDPDPETVEQSRETMRAVGHTVTARDFLTCDAFDVREKLDRVETPLLAVTGEHDSLTPIALQESLAGAVSGADHAQISDAAHLPMVERPDRFRGAFDLFLTRLLFAG